MTDRKTVIKCFAAAALMESICEPSSVNPSPMLSMLTAVMSKRYLFPRSALPKVDIYTRWNLLQGLDDRRVRQEIRMTLDSFHIFHDLIKDHELYTSKENGRPQIDLKIQMVVALSRLGSYGNANYVGRLSVHSGVSGKY